MPQTSMLDMNLAMRARKKKDSHNMGMFSALHFFSLAQGSVPQGERVGLNCFVKWFRSEWANEMHGCRQFKVSR
jgi:hypothetical protein